MKKRVLILIAVLVCVIFAAAGAVFFLLPQNQGPVEKQLRQAELETVFQYEGRENGFQEGLWALAHQDEAFLQMLTDGSLDTWIAEQFPQGTIPRYYWIAGTGIKQSGLIREFLEEYIAYTAALDSDIDLQKVLPYVASWERNEEGHYLYPVNGNDNYLWSQLTWLERQYVSTVPYYVADDATDDEMVELFFSYPNHEDWLMLSTLSGILPKLAEAVPSFADIIYGEAIPAFFEHKGIDTTNYRDYVFPGLEEAGYYSDLAHGNMAVFLLNPEDLY